jgi:hypothetical protein
MACHRQKGNGSDVLPRDIAQRMDKIEVAFCDLAKHIVQPSDQTDASRTERRQNYLRPWDKLFFAGLFCKTNFSKFHDGP